MIVIGYQGIGKSTLAGADKGCIDLESSNFFIDGKRDENWYKIYANIAINLSEQGFVVFTSSHKVVRDELAKSDERKVIINPSIELKEDWITKLEERYISTNLEKDLKAYLNAKSCYEENINELMLDTNFINVVLEDMNYSLEDIVRTIS